MKKIPQDIIGNIAILKFKRRTPSLIKKIKAYIFLKNHKGVTTVLEKISKFSGKTRLQETKHLAGELTKKVKYIENNCTFYFNIDKTYFSPRLSNERKMIAKEVLKIYNKKKKLKILVMFSGVSVFPIVIGKYLKQNKKTKFMIYSNEINKDANEYARKNIHQNKLTEHIKLIPGDAKKIPDLLKKLKKEFQNKKSPKALAFAKKGGRKIFDFSFGRDFEIPEKFDIIIMTRPNLEETYLKTALKLSKKETKIFYHGFGKEEKVLEEIKKDTKGKIKNLKTRKAGNIGKEIYRWNAEFIVK